MTSVTNRIRQVEQPRGGYIKPSMFSKMVFEDGSILSTDENIHVSLIGLTVDYLTRFMMSGDVNAAFDISAVGYDNYRRVFGESEYENRLDVLLDNIRGLDDASIISACKAVTYDVWYRNPYMASSSKSAAEINPDDKTIQNIRIMVNRSVAFFKKFGPITAAGFSFIETDTCGNIAKTGYTDVVNAGDGDYLTDDTIWDFKVSKKAPDKNATLQILMYYIMGKHSKIDIFRNINKVGFFNPRLNTVYILETDKIPKEVIHTVENDVICY